MLLYIYSTLLFWISQGSNDDELTVNTHSSIRLNKKGCLRYFMGSTYSEHVSFPSRWQTSVAGKLVKKWAQRWTIQHKNMIIFFAS